MSNLKSLAFTSLPKTENSPIQFRCGGLIERLEEQKVFDKDPSHLRLTRKWQRKDGERVMTDTKVPVRRWWKVEEKGQVIFSFLIGCKPIEFEKGKGGILVGAMETLSLVIDTLIAAVQTGEFDNGFMPPKSGATTTKM